MEANNTKEKNEQVEPLVDTLVKRVMKDLSEDLFKGIQRSVNRRVRKELKTALAKAVAESEFYRSLNKDMMQGLQGIYHEITHATGKKNVSSTISHEKENTDRILSDASKQLDEIMVTTEEATLSIMNLVERHLDLQANVGEILAHAENGTLPPEELKQLIEINANLSDDLINIMTTLSFQDLTGQRIKKIVAALHTIEKTVFDLYMSTGLVLLAKEKAPEKNLDEIKEETKQVVSELKGPQLATSQASVDDLLSSLGM